MAKQGMNPGANQGGLSELWARLRFVLIAILVYRIGAHIPVPGINPDRLAAMFEQNQGTILAMFNMFSGGALERMSILALGIMPYISASIIMQLMTAVNPQLEQLKKEGEAGRRKISQYTRYGTVILATVQSFAMAVGLAGQGIAFSADLSFYFVAVVTLVSGAVFLMWLGEQVTEKGIGNGISIIIFAGIVAGLPGAIGQSFEAARQGDLNIIALLAIAVLAVATVAFVVFMERALRKIIIQYPRRQVGMKVMEGQNSHLPVKVNPAGVIPAIFASSLLLLPTTVSTFSGSQTGPVMSTILAYFGPGQPLYLAFFTAMIVCFAYF